MTARFRIAQAGPHVSYQDAGRLNMARFGVTQAGPMDRLAHRAGFAALGQRPGTAIEVSLGGLRLECLEGSVSLAVTGGGFIVESERAYSSWQVLTISPGQSLTIRRGPWGSWCYLAFAGDLISPRWLGSAATQGATGLGGGKLVAGGEVLVTEARSDLPARALPCPIFARPRHQLGVTLGPQDRFFAPETLQSLLGQAFNLTDAYDRMGVRLSGPDLSPNVALTMPSEPIARGALQVAGDGVATLLLADHQTTGGYPKIATVLDCDLDAAVQLRSRDALRFTAVSPETAIARARQQARATEAYLAALQTMPPPAPETAGRSPATFAR
jgi:5-oxoprolinase (ATP-hydrolysing) subunit C